VRKRHNKWVYISNLIFGFILIFFLRPSFALGVGERGHEFLLIATVNF
jgi:hypothetical protein